jgi:hypothetical protein
MLMSTEKTTRVKVTLENLVRVQAGLDAAIDSLVSMRLSDGPNERDALTGEAAALLEEVCLRWRGEKQQTGQLELDSPDANLWKVQMLSLLHDIQVRGGQLQGLNEAALGLCRGWLAAAPLIDGYTPEGFGASAYEPNGLRIRA